MYKLYEIVIGEIKTVVDQEAKAEVLNNDGTVQFPAQELKTHTEDVGRVGDTKNVVAQNVDEAVTKAKPFLAEGQYLLSVTFLHPVHA